MQLNKLSVSIISILLTLAVCLSGSFYRAGIITEKICNAEKNTIRVEKDYKAAITKVEEKKADKDIVDLLFKKVDGVHSDVKQNNSDVKELKNLIINLKKIE